MGLLSGHLLNPAYPCVGLLYALARDLEFTAYGLVRAPLICANLS